MRINKRRLLLLLVVALFFAYSYLKATPAPTAQDLPLIEETGNDSIPVPEAFPPDGETDEGSEAPELPSEPSVGEDVLPETPAELPVLPLTEEDALPPAPADSEPEVKKLPEDGCYNSKEDVALYIHLYGHLPSNFITKKDAEALGWSGGRLQGYAPEKSIGGSRFGNYEGLLPNAKGRVYYECDIDTLHAKSRGAKRIVFSNDGLIYYTEDHYESFELLYGEP